MSEYIHTPSDITEQIRDLNSRGEDKKTALEGRIRKIRKMLDVYEKAHPEDIRYIRRLFEDRVTQIQKLDIDGQLKSTEPEALLWMGILEIREGDTIGGMAYRYNLDPTKILLRGNANSLKAGTTEAMTAEAAMTLRLKMLEKEWVLALGKDNIPVLRGDLPIGRQLEVLWMLDDFIGLQIRKGSEWATKFQPIKARIDELKSEYSRSISEQVRDISTQIHPEDTREYLWNLGSSFEWGAKKWTMDQIINWFESLPIEQRTALIALIAVVGIAAIVFLGPELLALAAGTAEIANILALRALILWGSAMANGISNMPGWQRVIPFLSNFLVPWAGRARIDDILWFQWTQRVAFVAGGMAKDAVGGISWLQGIFVACFSRRDNR